MSKTRFKIWGAIIFTFIFLAGPIAASAETIRLRVETSAGSLFNGELNVLPCKETADSETETLNAKCAIEQSGLLNDFSFWGTDAFLNSIGEYENNKDGNGIYWSYFLNLDYGMVALNKQIIKKDDYLLLVYNINPLKIEVSTTSPVIGDEVEAKISQFGLDAAWNPVWSLAPDSKIVMDTEEKDTTDGIYKFTASTTAPITVFGKKAGYLDSGEMIITPKEAPIDDGGEEEDEPIPDNAGIGGISPAAIPEKTFDLEKAIGFLSQKQKADGSFANPMLTDWAAIALAAYGQGENLEKIKSYYQSASDSGFSLTDYERRAMALMVLNINPYNGLKTNYIEKITSQFDGTQIGDKDYNNDDIFALLILENAGYGTSDEIIKKDADYILSGQEASGSFGGVDLTAAAIEALLPLRADAKANEAIVKAKNYLAASQNEDGGFGNGFSTSWVLMAINALGENIGQWTKNGNDPKEYLAGLQMPDGGMEKEDMNTDTRVWSTAYAIPAILGKDWNGLMNDFSKVVVVKNETPAGENPVEENKADEEKNKEDKKEEEERESETVNDKADKTDGEKLDENGRDANKEVLGEKIDHLDNLLPTERQEILKSYFDAFGKNPESESEWEDARKIANGRWPSQRNLEREEAVKTDFIKIYHRQPNMLDSHDNAAITIMAYGLCPQREVLKEQAALRTFAQVYGRLPNNYQDWNIIRAISYSGASR